MVFTSHITRHVPHRRNHPGIQRVNTQATSYDLQGNLDPYPDSQSSCCCNLYSLALASADTPAVAVAAADAAAAAAAADVAVAVAVAAAAVDSVSPDSGYSVVVGHVLGRWIDAAAVVVVAEGYY